MIRNIKTIDKELKAQFLVTCGIIGITFFAGINCILSNFVFGDIIDTINLSVSSSCTMSSAVDAHSASIVSGHSQSDIGTTNFTIACNDAGGYAIYAIGYSGESDGNTNLLAASPLTSSSNIITGTATSGDISNWSMKLVAANISGAPTVQNNFNNYTSIPSTYTKVIAKTSGTTASSVVATSTYQVFISRYQANGAYHGKVKYTLVHPSTACPDGYTLNSGSCVPIFGGITTMQAMTTSICTNAAVGDTKQLKDTRDNKYYWVTKLADNNCWMTQNLDLDLSSSITLTSDDTNIEDNWTPASTATTVVKTNLSTSNWGSVNDYTHPYSFDGGDAYLPNGVLSSACYNKDFTTCSGVGTLSLTDTATVLGNTNAHYHVGNYYNWTAAIASNDSSEYTTNYTNASSSICPKGWKLPSSYGGNSSTNGDFKNLLNNYSIGTNSDSVLLAAPLYFARSGSVNGGNLFFVGSGGNYWSSTATSSDKAYDFQFNSTYVGSTCIAYRYYDHPIRCLAE